MEEADVINIINEMEANQPANPESGEHHNQPEETGTDHVISISDSFQGRIRKFMGSQASVEEEDEGSLIGHVPKFLGRESEFNKYYQPGTMSIGPVHCGKKELEEGEEFKHKLTKSFMEMNRQKNVTLCNNILKEIQSFKKCYDQELLKNFHGNDEDLAWMFFVDGCALIQLTRCWYWDEYIPSDKLDLLTTELLLLDNQLPLGVLNLLMGFSKEGGELYPNDQSNEFRQSICHFIEIIKIIHFKRWEKRLDADRVSFNKGKHLLELIWLNLVKKAKDSRSDNTKAIPRKLRSAKDLQAAGIRLEPNYSSSSLRDISFNPRGFFGKLKIPPVRVSEQGKFLLFNLMAFEMLPNFHNDRVVTSYISFLNSLIATKEDVAELRDAGILFNFLQNDEEVLETFQKLTSDLKPFPDIFSATKEQIIKYFNTKKSMTTGRWLSEAMHIYFRTPWTTIAFVFATFLLILTIIQTIFSVLAYAQCR